MNTQKIINELHKINTITDKEKNIILLACEKLAFLQNKINSNKGS